MKRILVYLGFLLISIHSLWANNASNVRVQQRDKDIIITYDLKKTSNVQLLMSINYSSFNPINGAVEGAVGNHIHAGEGLTIIWHPLLDYEEFIAKNARFMIDAPGAYEQYLLPQESGGKTSMETFILASIAYSPTPQTSYGLMFGQTYHGCGWFVSAHSDFHFISATNGLSCDKDGGVKRVLPFYSGKKRTSSFTINGGLVLDILDYTTLTERNRFNTFGFYLGVGYGKRELLLETTDNKWIRYNPTSHKGFSANFGIIGSASGFTLMAGMNTINFRYLEMEAGIGWMF